MANPTALTAYPAPDAGMNLAKPAHEVPDNQAVVIQDAWVHTPGITIGRGALRHASGHTNFQGWINSNALGMFGGVNLNSQEVIVVPCILNVDDLKLKVYDLTLLETREVTLDPSFSGNVQPIFAHSPALGGGTFIGFSTRYQPGLSMAEQQLYLYRGAHSTLHNSTIAGLTITAGSAAITGGGALNNHYPGMFLVRDTSGPIVIGVVKSVESATAATLEAPSPANVVPGDTVRLYSAIGWYRRVSKGTITVAAGNVNVTGGETRFKAMGLANLWRIYRKSDNALVGVVGSVTDDDSLTLTAGAAYAMAEEEYFAVPPVDEIQQDLLDTTYLRPGFITAVYAGRQWYANRGIVADVTGYFDHRLWFSEIDDPLSVDFSIDGDHMMVESENVPDEPIRGLAPVEEGLLIMKARETFLLTGDSPDTFTIKKVLNDGCIGVGSIQLHKAGAIWAGNDGIYFFDGVEAHNIVQESLGVKYKRAVRNFDPNARRCHSLLYEEHYMLFIDKGAAVPTDLIKTWAAGISTDSIHTISIYLPTNALTLLTNMQLRGFHVSQNPLNVARFVINGPTGVEILDLSRVMSTELDTVDTVGSSGSVLGPNTYIQTKQYDVGNASIRKTWKMLITNFKSNVNISVDTILGLNADKAGSTVTTLLIATTDLFKTQRLKYIRRSTHIGFRLYRDPADSRHGWNLANIGVLYRPQRIGRV